VAEGAVSLAPALVRQLEDILRHHTAAGVAGDLEPRLMAAARLLRRSPSTTVTAATLVGALDGTKPAAVRRLVRTVCTEYALHGSVTTEAGSYSVRLVRAPIVQS
jgi:hypothetical protein